MLIIVFLFVNLYFGLIIKNNILNKLILYIKYIKYILDIAFKLISNLSNLCNSH